MSKLQETFDQQLARIPRIAIEECAREKLNAAGIVDESLAQLTADAILSGQANHTILSEVEVALKFTADDMARIEKAVSGFLEGLPELTERFTDDAAQRLVEGFRRQWQESAPPFDEAIRVRQSIAAKWGEAFNALRLLVALCAQEGEAFNFSHLRAKRQHERDQAIARLHIRACRIANEIILLLENGHTEGAQARWRTMHEVAITATIIAEGGDELAQRYFDHEAVEKKKALDDHRRAAAAVGERGVSYEHGRGIEQEFAAAIRKYGKPFQGMYGWASGQLGLPDNPQFHHLQDVAGSLSLKLRYRLASFDTHASPRTLSQPMHQWDPTTHIPGTFSAGFEGPASDAAQTMVQVTVLLYSEPWDLDRLALVRAMAQLRDELIADLHRIARRIARDEQRDIDRAVRRPGRLFGHVKRKPKGGWR
jgi:hypothetical protein